MYHKPELISALSSFSLGPVQEGVAEQRRKSHQSDHQSLLHQPEVDRQAGALRLQDSLLTSEAKILQTASPPSPERSEVNDAPTDSMNEDFGRHETTAAGLFRG